MRKIQKRNRIKATLMAAAIAALPLLASTSIHAAGLGKITVLSALGQPLRAELEVTATKDEAQSVQAKVASADAFRQAGIEYSTALSTLRFSRDIKERGGRRYLELTTDRPLNEPFIDMLVELSWASGRLVREYTFLLDPPELMPKTEPVAINAPEVKTEPVAAKPGVTTPAAAEDGTSTGDARPAVSKRPSGSSASSTKAASRSSAAPAASTGERKVLPGETLGKIAAQTKPEGVNLDQMLVALFRSNSDAFDGANMNRLKAGKILAIPDAETVGNISAETARKEIIAQSSDFNAYRNKLAGAAKAEPAREPAAKQSDAGKIAPKVEDKAPPVSAGKDKLAVSRTETAKDGAGKGAKDKPLQGRIATLEEDLVARDRALKDANSRVAALEKNLNDLKKLAEIKSKGGAELEKQSQAAKPVVAETAKPAAPAVPAAAPAPAPAVVAEKPVEAAKPVDAPKPAEVAKPAEAAKPAEGAKPAESAPPPPKKKPLPPPEPEPEPSFVEENMPLVFGGGATLALLLGWLGISAYRKKKAGAIDKPVSEGDLSAHSVFSSTTVAPPPSEQEPSMFSSTGFNVAASDAVDPVVEADTFLAFGRDAQAEEILLEAMKTDSQRLAIPLKLLDIYATRKNPSQFMGVARQLHELTGGTGPEWDKAAAMGAALDPENALYGVATAAPVQPAPSAASAPDFGATMILSAPTVQPAPAEAPPEESSDAAVLDFDLDLDAAEPATANAASESFAANNAEVAALDIDFDMPAAAPADTLDVPLALDIGDISAPQESKPVSEPAQAMPLDANNIDFEFDLGAPAAAPEPEPEPEPESVAALDVDLGFEMPVLPTPEATASSSAAPVLDMDIAFDMPAATPPPAEPLMTPGIDLAGISLDLDAPEPSISAEPEIAVSSASTFAEAAEATIPDNPEVATKLELALAYEEMGDRDGARELYQEAFNEGSPGQQAAARAKLDGLG